MPFLLGFVGLVFGAMVGGFWGAIILCAAGAWLGNWINRSDAQRKQQHGAANPVSPPPTPAKDDRPPLDDFDSLREEVLALRRRVDHLEAGRPVAKAAQATPVVQETASPPPPAPTPKPDPVVAPAWGAPPKVEPWAGPQAQPKLPLREEPVVPTMPQGPSLIARLFSGNIVAKVGVVVLFFGVGFLLKFAYDRGLMPPELRLLGVAVTAAGMFGTGWWLRESRRLYGLILQGGASGLAYLDVFFALKTYGFIGPVTGFALFAALGVATTFVAVRQDARTLAVLGLGGAFLAPVLASTGAGNHVLLFSYYLLLNAFILGVSWFRAWRELNLTGWLFTFVIGLFWGKANYRPELFGSVEPFVLAFFAIYLLVPILFATRQPPQLKGLVDGTLVFGTPAAVAFMQAELVKGMPYGLAWSAAIGGALYALLAGFTWRRENMRLLAETYAALAVGLGTLAVFFAFDAYPTFAFWTIEGAAILWVGLRQARPLARAFGLLVQLAGAGLFISEYGQVTRAHWLMNDAVYGSLLIAVASLISARLLYRYAERLRGWESIFGPGMLLWGALWWSVGGVDALHHGVARSTMPNAAALFFLATFATAEIAGQWLNWGALRNLAGFHPVVLVIVLLSQFALNQHPLGGLGGLAWPLGLAVAYHALYRQERDEIALLQAARHALGLWLAVAVAGLELNWWVREWQFGSAWQTSVWGLCTAAALAGVVRWGDRGKWPVAAHRDIYRGLVLGPVGAFTVAWALFANFKAPGSMAPLPYLPLLNPVDAMVGLSLGALWAWSRWFIDPASASTGALRKAAGALGFIWLNGIALRSVHYWAGVPYELAPLFHSVLVQSTLSLLWASAALALMFLARRRLERGLWAAGAVLLGAVVAKLFLVDLANSGTVARIVSFLGVGALLLVIGYLAPVPPGSKEEGNST